MSALERSSLVKSTAGRTGGFELARSATSITLADVYGAVEDDNVFRPHKINADAKCPIAQQLMSVLATPLKTAETALKQSLGLTTLQDVFLKFA